MIMSRAIVRSVVAAAPLGAEAMAARPGPRGRSASARARRTGGQHHGCAQEIRRALTGIRLRRVMPDPAGQYVRPAGPALDIRLQPASRRDE